jgi:hypothetical protein
MQVGFHSPTDLVSTQAYVKNGFIDISPGRSTIESKNLPHLSYVLHATTYTGTAVSAIP